MSEVGYDPGFQAAVARGHLSVHDALQRGSRHAYAANLVKRYGLTSELAYLVADNRLRLAEAVRRVAAAASVDERPAPRPVAWAPNRKALGLAALAVLALTVHSWWVWTGFVERSREIGSRVGLAEPGPPPDAVSTHDGSTAPPASPDPAAAPASDSAARPSVAVASSLLVERNAMGQVTRVAGADPRSVLVGFCDAFPGEASHEPLELARPAHAFPGTWFGIYLDRQFPGERFALTIRLDRRTHRWIAGDGTRPLGAAPAGAIAAESRVPVERS